MPVNTGELLSAVSILAENRHMRVTVKESFKAGCVAGASTMVGGLLLGPAGIILGGIIGTCSAAAISQGKFKSVAHVITHDMTYSERERLACAIRAVIADFRIEDAALLLPLLMNNVSLPGLVMREVAKFLQAELGLQVLS